MANDGGPASPRDIRGVDVHDERTQRLLESAMRDLPVGVALVAAPRGEALFRNAQATALFGRSLEAAPVDSIADYGTFTGFRADGSPYAADEWPVARSILRGEIVDAEEAEILRDDGTRAFIRMSSAPVRDAAGAIVAGLVTFHDITTARRLESQTAVLYRLSDAANRAERTEDVYEAALDAIAALLGAPRASILTFDDAGVMRFRAWRGVSDAYRAAVDGHSPWTRGQAGAEPILVPDVAKDASLRAYGDLFVREGIGALAFIPLVYGNRVVGKFMLYAEAPRTWDAHQRELAGAIAAQVASAVGRAESERALLEASRRKDEFLAMLSHELRNPLAAVRNAVHLLVRTEIDAARRARCLDVIDRQSASLARLVDDLLDVSRVTRGRVELRKERTDVGSVVARAIDALAAALAQHRLMLQTHSERLAVEGDPVRLEQVVTNLLANAVRYTPPGGEISIELTRDGADVVVVVRDTGIGIDAARLERIFELFDQGGRDPSRTQGGLGIGLTVARGLVELHGGRLTAASDGLGRGSSFTVRIPAAPETGAVAAATVAARSDASRRRVLLVDDHVDAREMLATILAGWGHEVDALGDPHAVAERLAAFAPDVVLLDIGLPGKDGYTVAREIRGDTRFDRVPLVALTGYGQDADRARALANGFSDHLVKPVQPEALRDLLGRMGPG